MRMSIPRIRTRATNVELTGARKSLITRRLAPLSRMLKGEGEVDIEVMLRRTETQVEGTMYFVSVKLITPQDSHRAVAANQHLTRALDNARDMLRQSMSRGESVSPYRVSHESFEESFTLTI